MLGRLSDAWRSALLRRWLRQRRIKLATAPGALARDGRLEIEEGAALGRLEISSAALAIGAHTYMRSGGELQNVASIGRFCSIGRGVVIGQESSGHPLAWVSSHPFPCDLGDLPRPASRHAPCRVGNDVWIGREALIMEGVSVASGAVIGARAIVTADVPAYAIVVGTPARISGYRHPESLRQRLLASAWWELPLDLLLALPLADPELFLAALSARREQGELAKARYRRVALGRRWHAEIDAIGG